MSEVTFKKKDGVAKIYIDGILHLYIKDLVAIYSYEDTTGLEDSMRYFIEIRFATGSIRLEYDNKELWIQILNVIDTLNEPKG